MKLLFLCPKLLFPRILPSIVIKNYYLSGVFIPYLRINYYFCRP